MKTPPSPGWNCWGTQSCTAPILLVASLPPNAATAGFCDVVLENRLRDALTRLNPKLPPEALEDAYRRLTRTAAPSLVERNRAVHRMLVDGIEIEHRHALARRRHD